MLKQYIFAAGTAESYSVNSKQNCCNSWSTIIIQLLQKEQTAQTRISVVLTAEEAPKSDQYTSDGILFHLTLLMPACLLKPRTVMVLLWMDLIHSKNMFYLCVISFVSVKTTVWGPFRGCWLPSFSQVCVEYLCFIIIIPNHLTSILWHLVIIKII